MNRPQISDAEWQVMNTLWQSSPRAAHEVADELCDRMNWHPRTVKTLLGRLVKKGILTYHEKGNRYLYEPKLPREHFVRAETQSFLDRVFNGDASPALVHFVEKADLSREELEELRKILDDKLE